MGYSLSWGWCFCVGTISVFYSGGKEGELAILRSNEGRDGGKEGEKEGEGRDGEEDRGGRWMMYVKGIISYGKGLRALDLWYCLNNL